jgi:hypothetical protein
MTPPRTYHETNTSGLRLTALAACVALSLTACAESPAAQGAAGGQPRGAEADGRQGLDEGLEGLYGDPELFERTPDGDPVGYVNPSYKEARIARTLPQGNGRITAELDQASYAPGDSARLSIANGLSHDIAANPKNALLFRIGAGGDTTQVTAAFIGGPNPRYTEMSVDVMPVAHTFTPWGREAYTFRLDDDLEPGTYYYEVTAAWTVPGKRGRGARARGVVRAPFEVTAAGTSAD